MKKINKTLLELYGDRKQLLFLGFLVYISYLMEGLIPSSPNVIQASAAISAVVVSAIGIGVTAYTAKKNRDAAEKMADDANALQAAETAKLDAQKEEYKKMKFENPYENMENKYTENVYEDLTVNQQQAQFQAQQGSQQRANIMQSMKGAAGGSGIAALAQAMANQGQLQTQKISASIGQQEAQNQKLAAAGALKVQSGEDAVQSMKLGGEQWLQEKEMDRQATLLGMQMGASAGANLGAQNAALNQQQVTAAGNQAMAQSVGQFGSTVASTDFSSGGGGSNYSVSGDGLNLIDEGSQSPRIDD
jgi:hypothetical protein